MKAKFQVREDTTRIEVGETEMLETPEPHEWFVFGDTAEVWVDASWGETRVQVSQGSIGSHDADRAKKRIAAYSLAAEIAMGFENRLAAGQSQKDAAEDLRTRFENKGMLL